MYKVPKVKRKKIQKQSKSLNKKRIIVLTNVFVNLPSISFENKKVEFPTSKDYRCELEFKNIKGTGRRNENQHISKDNMNESFYSIEPWDIP